MRIIESAVSMIGRYSYTETRMLAESLILRRRGGSNERRRAITPVNNWEKQEGLTDPGSRGIRKGKARSPGKIKNGEPVGWEISEKDRQKILILEKLLYALTGKHIKIQIPKLPKNAKDTETTSSKIVAANETIQNQASQSWRMRYNRIEAYRESESFTFNASGVIKTADGEKIEFSVELNMSREFAMISGINFTAVEKKPVDPIVINYSGKAAELTETKFRFDLDNNGEEDLVSFLKPGSGFLVLDTNNDGIVHNGSQLFGPVTGDGFSELAAYDADNNGWIDAADPVYEHLRIWTKDENGNDCLFALGEKGVGAVFLGNIDALFHFKDGENQLSGKNQKAGIFVGTNGTVGTVQQIDLVI